MLKIARRAGASVVRAGAEAEAVLELPPDTFASHFGALVEQRAAEINYQLKRGARQLGSLIGTRTTADHVAEE